MSNDVAYGGGFDLRPDDRARRARRSNAWRLQRVHDRRYQRKARGDLSRDDRDARPGYRRRRFDRGIEGRRTRRYRHCPSINFPWSERSSPPVFPEVEQALGATCARILKGGRGCIVCSTVSFQATPGRSVFSSGGPARPSVAIFRRSRPVPCVEMAPLVTTGGAYQQSRPGARTSQGRVRWVPLEEVSHDHTNASRTRGQGRPRNGPTLQRLAARGDPAPARKQPRKRGRPRQSCHLHVDRARGA